MTWLLSHWGELATLGTSAWAAWERRRYQKTKAAHADAAKRAETKAQELDSWLLDLSKSADPGTRAAIERAIIAGDRVR